MTKQDIDAFIYIVVCAAKNEKININYIKNVSLDSIYSMASFHKLNAFVAYALENAGIQDEKFHESLGKAIKHQALFEIERGKVIGFLNKSDIPYMLLKGIIIEKYYPKTYLREMADNDILFDSRYADELYEFFISENYELYSTKEHSMKYGCYSFHKNPVYNFEMHTKLFSDDLFHKLNQYYSDVFSKLELIKGSEYAFTLNDLYIFFTLHEYKHYSYAGVGIRSLVDNYLIRQKLNDKLDYEYIYNELKKVGAYDLEVLRKSIVDKIFSDPISYELTDEENILFSEYITSGAYGTDKKLQRKVTRLLLDKSNFKSEKLKKIMYSCRLVLGNQEIYKSKYPVLSQHKILLPVCFLIRLCSAISKGAVTREISKLKAVDQNDTTIC